MFSKETSRRLREDFWVSFGKSHPRKWVLYKTKIKGLSLKFHFNTSQAMVSLDAEGDLERRIALWEKLLSLNAIFKTYAPTATFDEYHVLENGKEISRIYVTLPDVSIHNKKSWQPTMSFLYTTMAQSEAFFEDYKEVLQTP